MPSLGKLPIYGQSTSIAPRWRSPGELETWLARAEQASAEADPAAKRGWDEFPEGAAEPPQGVNRRSFLQLMGAAAGLAGLQACKPRREPLVPYVRQVANVIPSVPNAYATAFARGGLAVGAVVTSWEGRPTKIEGNPEHPSSLGATDATLQAEILDLYDPERTRGAVRDRRHLGPAALFEELSELARAHEKDGGARLRFLVEPTSSPTLEDLRRRILARFPRARFTAWSSESDAQARAGAALAFGRPLEAHWSLPEADVILALDADLLARDGEPLRQSREYAGRRVDAAKMNRLYVAEPAYTVTGGMADHRFRMRAAEVVGFARAVAAELAARHGLATLAPLGGNAPAGLEKAAAAVANDLARARGRSLVAAGPRQPAAVHALAAALNDALGNAGVTVRYRASALLDPEAGPGDLAALVKELQAGAVDTLVVTAWNPLYTAPADLDLRAAFGKARERIVLALRADETWAAATWKVAATHPLEAWGDLRARDGTVSIVQPLIAPLRETISEVELLAAFVDAGDRGGHALVREGWRARTGDPGFDLRWNGWLAAGVVAGSAFPVETPALDAGRIAAALGDVRAPGGGVEVNFALDYKVRDGRQLDNAWLQELPDPVTKLTWDNAVHVSPATAKRLGLASKDEVQVSVNGRTVQGGVLVVPGHADDAVTLALGYGRKVAGPVGKGTGFDAYALRSAAAPWFTGGGELRRTGKKVELVTTQEHFDMEGRYIAPAYAASELAHAQEELEHHRGIPATIHEPVDYSKQDYSWGMNIDLSRCIGCGACTLACQAENNIPTVGKAQVAKSREMHWLRVDRYFEGSLEEPTSVSQPLGCVHCETAPCEYVCPVNATVHSEEGLNQMVYNRCVGTRYCSNNCPYKVRRFNWFDFHDRASPTLKMLHNPDVTVRARGVMEKCTYCVQRIERARNYHGAQGGKIGGDEVQSACQQACPTQAIVFGNLNDPESTVARRHRDGRRFNLLHELGTRPHTAYLVQLRNPNPELA
ncbi:MAG TPA: Fe-S-cluster-containing hydrogenase [Anaeromyxobacter sp.]|nr:Fe-S-cluster-containing hydrogenase [Anaeromyxobacter sp.]